MNESTDDTKLTKREQFAMAAMQGLLSDIEYPFDETDLADALLAELGKGVSCG